MDSFQNVWKDLQFQKLILIRKRTEGLILEKYKKATKKKRENISTQRHDGTVNKRKLR